MRREYGEQDPTNRTPPSPEGASAEGATPTDESGSGNPQESEPGQDPMETGSPSGPSAAAVQELESEYRALNDRHLRLVAEFDNFRRRVNQERLETWGRAQAELVGSLLDTLDDLQRVSDLDPDSATATAILEGVELVERKFLRTLQDAGIEEIHPHDQPFDPNIMEAVMRVPTGDPDQDDDVAQVFQKGYSFKGHLVRPARVSVYKAG